MVTITRRRYSLDYIAAVTVLEVLGCIIIILYPKTSMIDTIFNNVLMYSERRGRDVVVRVADCCAAIGDTPSGVGAPSAELPPADTAAIDYYYPVLDEVDEPAEGVEVT
ncbi:unnamed protein product [Macrosiphum euphorbiae]|uniref:Uncharacterized protein n=1 Tax=Macrosiphum euphorbiae TaxID=13131 RepID=A0AAV0XXB0_9HEMI|nr:unnamed protein product [Macrosiphum euphorbiae]